MKKLIEKESNARKECKDRKDYTNIFLMILVGITLFTFLSPAAAFSDVSQEHPNSPAIEYFAESGVIIGQGNSDSFTPESLLNRAEWMSIMMRHFQLSPSTDEFNNCFPDVGSEWFAAAVCYSVGQGWIKGYQAGPEAGKFIPINKRCINWCAGKYFCNDLKKSFRPTLLHEVIVYEGYFH